MGKATVDNVINWTFGTLAVAAFAFVAGFLLALAIVGLVVTL